MAPNLYRPLERERDLIRRRFLEYTRRAFQMLPRLVKPRILDVGCGSGIPTLELAKLSRGEIIALDIDRIALDELARKAEEEGLSERVKIVNRSLLDMDFPDCHFDVIWSEGAIRVVGFRRGLEQWRRLLKPGGFLAVHDERTGLEQKLKDVVSCGYDLVGYFELDQKTWWAEYFGPLEKLISETEDRKLSNPYEIRALDCARRDLDTFRSDPERNTSVFFVMRRNERCDSR
jgi:ubiquinone/menaquinone biosynthesis C-methylase UbiE